MRRKILAIIVSMLFLSVIPSVLGINTESEDREPCLDIGRCFYRGIALNLPNSEPDTYFVIWLCYQTLEGKQWILFDWVTLRDYRKIMLAFI